jgi:hypothetical protein
MSNGPRAIVPNVNLMPDIRFAMLANCYQEASQFAIQDFRAPQVRRTGRAVCMVAVPLGRSKAMVPMPSGFL